MWLDIQVPADCRLVEIVRLHDEGKTNTEISKRIGYSIPIVSHLLASIGRKANHSRQVDERHEHILRLRKNGLTYREIGQKVGLTFQAVFNCCKKNGLTQPKE